MSRQERLASRLIHVFWQYSNSTKLDDINSKTVPGSGKYAGEGNMDPNNLE
jgi:hypothetical protein